MVMTEEESLRRPSTLWSHLWYEKEIKDGESDKEEEEEEDDEDDHMYQDLLLDHAQAIKVCVPGHFRELKDAEHEWSRADIDFLRNGNEQVFTEENEEEEEEEEKEEEEKEEAKTPGGQQGSKQKQHAVRSRRHLVFPLQSLDRSAEGVAKKMGLDPVQWDKSVHDDAATMELALGTRPWRELVFLAKQVEFAAKSASSSSAK